MLCEHAVSLVPSVCECWPPQPQLACTSGGGGGCSAQTPLTLARRGEEVLDVLESCAVLLVQSR